MNLKNKQKSIISTITKSELIQLGKLGILNYGYFATGPFLANTAWSIYRIYVIWQGTE